MLKFEESTKNRVIYFDLLNICACICVIALHVNTAVWTFSYDRYWQTSMIIETICYWAVPAFFMLSGATLLDYRKRYNTKTFFKKRFVRTFIPFVFWSFVSVIWGVYIGKTLDPSVKLNWKSILDIVVNTKAMSIYWFFPALFSVYLAIPILSLISDEMRKKAFLYLIIYSLITDSCLPLLCKLIHIDFNTNWQNPLGGGYLLFLLLGYLLSKQKLTRQMRYLIYAGGIAGWALRYFMSIRLSYQAGKIDQTFYGYTNLPSVLLAIAVFVWFQYHDWSLLNGFWTQKVIQVLSAASFGVYLIHYYILCFLISHFAIDIRTWQWRCLGVFVVYSLALAVVLVLQRIPGVKKLVP